MFSTLNIHCACLIKMRGLFTLLCVDIVLERLAVNYASDLLFWFDFCVVVLFKY